MPQGKKFDTEKLRMDLIPPAVFEELALVLGMGAAKYGAYNWHLGVQFSRLYAATLRHLILWWEGEDLDSESGLSHVSHAMCNLAFLAQFLSEGRGELDDRNRMYGAELTYNAQDISGS